MTVIEVDHKQRPQLEAFNPSVRHAKIISNLQTTTYGMNLSEAHTHLPIKQLSCQILNGFSSMRSIGSARRRDSRGLQRAGTADRTLCINAFVSCTEQEQESGVPISGTTRGEFEW